MGDADGEVMIQLSAQEAEAWMDEGVELIDEGFEILLALVTNLNERTKGKIRSMLPSFRVRDCSPHPCFPITTPVQTGTCIRGQNKPYP
ncbi:hypothetical protein AVEN_186515-1 [Araneus ventricosus]|uniref:Uncharacterized protein n=2 Tax=Araneus ventricosus TaxID=182803 RepID=A0A4Y2SVP1_ARAVE|nr:hypothetical protein AVEN_186515-1 [Araneus ventricosus]